MATEKFAGRPAADAPRSTSAEAVQLVASADQSVAEGRKGVCTPGEISESRHESKTLYCQYGESVLQAESE